MQVSVGSFDLCYSRLISNQFLLTQIEVLVNNLVLDDADQCCDSKLAVHVLGLGSGSWQPPKPNLGVSAPQPGPPAPPWNQPSRNNSLQ